MSSSENMTQIKHGAMQELSFVIGLLPKVTMQLTAWVPLCKWKANLVSGFQTDEHGPGLPELL